MYKEREEERDSDTGRYREIETENPKKQNIGINSFLSMV